MYEILKMIALEEWGKRKKRYCNDKSLLMFDSRCLEGIWASLYFAHISTIFRSQLQANAEALIPSAKTARKIVAIEQAWMRFSVCFRCFSPLSFEFRRCSRSAEPQVLPKEPKADVKIYLAETDKPRTQSFPVWKNKRGLNICRTFPRAGFLLRAKAQALSVTFQAGSYERMSRHLRISRSLFWSGRI